MTDMQNFTLHISIASSNTGDMKASSFYPSKDKVHLKLSLFAYSHHRIDKFPPMKAFSTFLKGMFAYPCTQKQESKDHSFL
ncbi:hypothetical protein NC653_016416 [Populus alba x Populus x berolinensis]|uniref:Uncharacterized protein n=1 Tax=Populus alba x Populus x berolinensis TaxID=444605 RepID=A0AAD6QN25_9ROSI|nr:hypothetical protein NC653_016416 [Populus alba x Populus x berolinensis]